MIEFNTEMVGCYFKHEINEYRGKKCYFSAKRFCFVKRNKLLTGGDYKQQHLYFNRNEKRRSKIMTEAKFQPFCRVKKYILGYYDETSVFPRSVTDKNNALFLYNNHFCLKWKSEKVSFNQANEELEQNFKKVDSYITEENVKSHFDFTYTPTK